nr:MAG TPA: hypothetical protein [Caudoviricetes sp.]
MITHGRNNIIRCNCTTVIYAVRNPEDNGEIGII